MIASYSSLACSMIGTFEANRRSISEAIQNRLNIDEEVVSYWGGRKQSFQSPILMFQQRYTNSDSGFMTDFDWALKVTKIRSNATNLKQRKKLFAWADDLNVKKAKNPHLSLTRKVEHALRYGFGLKSYLNEVLRPDYSVNGVPSNSLIGHFLYFHVPEKWMARAMDVVALHDDHQLKINPRIVTEAEVTFHGGLPKSCFANKIDLEVPNLHLKIDKTLWPSFTPAKVAEFKQKLKRNHPEVRNKVEIEILNTALQSYLVRLL